MPSMQDAAHHAEPAAPGSRRRRIAPPVHHELTVLRRVQTRTHRVGADDLVRVLLLVYRALSPSLVFGVGHLGGLAVLALSLPRQPREPLRVLHAVSTFAHS